MILNPLEDRPSLTFQGHINNEDDDNNSSLRFKISYLFRNNVIYLMLYKRRGSN